MREEDFDISNSLGVTKRQTDWQNNSTVSAMALYMDYLLGESVAQW